MRSTTVTHRARVAAALAALWLAWPPLAAAQPEHADKAEHTDQADHAQHAEHERAPPAC